MVRFDFAMIECGQYNERCGPIFIVSRGEPPRQELDCTGRTDYGQFTGSLF